MANDELSPINIDVLHAGEGLNLKVPSDTPCRLCPEPILPGHAVVRIRDFEAGPGVRQHVMHKSCVQLLLDATVDDVEVIESNFVAYRNMLIERRERANISN